MNKAERLWTQIHKVQAVINGINQIAPTDIVKVEELREIKNRLLEWEDKLTKEYDVVTSNQG